MIYSPFAYVSNNPLYFIDPNGQFKYPTKYENEYSKNYSKFTQMLKNISIIENDNSLLDAISKFSGLSLNRIKDDFKWGNGPFIEFIDIPGDNLGMFKTGISSDVLYIDIDLANLLEQSEGDNFDIYLFLSGEVTIHEYIHYGNDQLGIEPSIEMGDQFELDYFNIDIRGYHSSIDALNNYNQKRGNSKRYSPEYEIDEIEISP